MNPWTPLVLATLGWGSSAVLTRAILQSGVSTFTLLPFRIGIALAIILVVSLLRRPLRGLGREHWRRGIVLGVVAMTIPNALLTLALEDVPVSLGGLLIALIPLTTIVAAHFVVPGERFNPKSIPGLLVSVLGTAVLVGIGGATMTGVDNLGRGVTIALIGVVLAGIGSALTRKFALEVGGEGLVIPQFATATVLFVLIMPVLGESTIGAIEPSAWLMIAVLGSFGTAVPFAAFLFAAEINPASRLGVSGYLVPVVAVVLAVIFLNETITLTVLAGASLIVGGVILTERATKHVPEPGIVTAQ